MKENNIQIRCVDNLDHKVIDQIVNIHLTTFEGFFLTFMGRGFLKLMYRSYVEYDNSGVLVAFENEKPIGFLAYSGDLSGLYKYMIRKRLIPFAWYSIGAFFRKPKVFARLIRAFLKPNEAERDVKYVELASIGVKQQSKCKGIGSKLIEELIRTVDFGKYKYITLETDATRNEEVNRFYCKNSFVLVREYETHEGRKMNEYRYYKDRSEKL